MNNKPPFSPGSRVAYTPPVVPYGGFPEEFGTVSSRNDRYVFVKFDAQVEKLGWEGTTSQSCSPEDLKEILS